MLEAAGRLPRFLAINIKAGLHNGVGIQRNNSPSSSVGETPVVVLGLQVLRCTNFPTDIDQPVSRPELTMTRAKMY